MRRTIPPTPRPWTVRRPLLWAALAAVILAGVTVVAVFPPTETAWYPKCTFRELTGYHCPGCGTARALHALFHGRVWQAVLYNPFTVAAVLYAAWEPINSAVARWRRRPKRTIATWLVWTFVGLLLAFGVLRNVPYEPFTLLAPHEVTR